MTELDKGTHVFLKNAESFTSISKREIDGNYQVFTTEKISTQTADEINELFGANLEVTRLNFEQGFLIFRLKRKSTYKHIVKAIKTVIYGKS